MRLGISSWTYAWSVGVAGFPAPSAPLDAFGLLAKARELGVGVLQIADNLPLERLSANELGALAARARDWGIRLEPGTRGVRPERLLPFLDIAAHLRARLVRTLLHDDLGCPTLEQAGEFLRALLPELERRDLVLAVENHDFFPTRQLRTLVEGLHSPRIGVCLDPVNNFAQGESTREVLDNLGVLSVNFHCKDYVIRRKLGGLGFDVEGAPAGEGMLDLDLCQARLDESMSCIIELWTPWQGSTESTIALEADWARRSVHRLNARLGGRP